MIESKSRNRNSGLDGFSIIEMLIVLAVLGILAAIAVPTFLGQRTKAMRSEAIANLESLRLLEEQYFAENGCYYMTGGTCTDTTISGADNIQAFLPGFRPGEPNRLNFTYQIQTTNSAASFVATATGKAGTAVDNTTLSIDQDNNRVGF